MNYTLYSRQNKNTKKLTCTNQLYCIYTHLSSALARRTAADDLKIIIFLRENKELAVNFDARQFISARGIYDNAVVY